MEFIGRTLVREGQRELYEKILAVIPPLEYAERSNDDPKAAGVFSNILCALDAALATIVVNASVGADDKLSMEILKKVRDVTHDRMRKLSVLLLMTVYRGRIMLDSLPTDLADAMRNLDETETKQ